MLYQIHWRSLITGTTGHGTKAFPHEEAQRYVDMLNEKYAGLLHHWVSAQQAGAPDAANAPQEPARAE